jgi:hypothetical protein
MTLRWEAPVAPYRAITSLRIVDENNNEIYKLSNIGSTSFSQDSSLKYYLPITGLNIEVPKNGYKSVFVEVTAVGTYPAGLIGTNNIIEIKKDDIRGRDGAGIDRFGPSNNLTYRAKFEATLASSASIISNLNVNSPKSKYLVSDDYNTGLGNKVKVLSFDLKAKNDDLRIAKIQGLATGSATITAVYITPSGDNNTVYDTKAPNNSGEFTLDISNNNVVINKDQIKSFDILVDFEAPVAGTIHTTTISIATTTAYSITLGDTKDYNTTTPVRGSLMYITRVAPEFTLVNKDLDRSYNSTTNTSTVSRVRYEINIKAVGADVYLPKNDGLKVRFSGPISATNRDIDIYEVRDVAGNIISENPSGYYRIPEGNTYKVIYDETFTTPITYTGDIRITAEVTELNWDNDNNTANGQHTATFFNV